MLLLQKHSLIVVNRNSLFTRRNVVIGDTELELLDEKIIFQRGSYKKVQRWYKGSHPIGVIIKGLTGWETVVEQDVFVPMNTFHVNP